MASRAAARRAGSAKAPRSVLRESPLVRAEGNSRTRPSPRSDAWEIGTYSATSTSLVRSALARAVPSATNFTSTPGASALSPQ
ncbi:hypothetical protein SCALM49S_01468 [Streptomyces californicus]